VHTHRRLFFPTMTSLLVTVVLLTVASNAGAVAQAEGYAEDSEGNIIRSGYHNCVHSGAWSPEMANVVGCDGVTLERQVEIIEGAATGLVTKVTIPAAALFAFDKDELTEEGKVAMEEYRAKLGPELSDVYQVLVIGHTDSVGDADYNVGLSLRRAESVRDYLTSTGVLADDKLAVLGRGENDPIASNDTDDGRALNRRVEIVVIGEVRALDTIRFPSVALFPKRQWELTPEAKQLLDSQRGEASDMLSRATYIEVVGHTDNVDTVEYNQDLSEKRANSVRDYLVGTGIDPTKIVARGAGIYEPVASNQTDEGKAQNRRVDVLVLGRVR